MNTRSRECLSIISAIRKLAEAGGCTWGQRDLLGDILWITEVSGALIPNAAGGSTASRTSFQWTQQASHDARFAVCLKGPDLQA